MQKQSPQQQWDIDFSDKAKTVWHGYAMVDTHMPAYGYAASYTLLWSLNLLAYFLKQTKYKEDNWCNFHLI